MKLTALDTESRTVGKQEAGVEHSLILLMLTKCPNIDLGFIGKVLLRQSSLLPQRLQPLSIGDFLHDQILGKILARAIVL